MKKYLNITPFDYIAFISIVGILILVSSKIYSQENNYSFEHVKIEDGLSQSTLLSVLQDKTGYMWFGTFNGLNRFDGYNFKVYANIPGDSTSISDNVITAMYEDKDGLIWIGTYEGTLNKFDIQTGDFTRYQISLDNELLVVTEEDQPSYPIGFLFNNDNTITSIKEDAEGYLWIGTWGNGLIKFARNVGVVSHYFNDPANFFSLSYNRVTDIIIDKKGSLWIGTYGGGLNRMLFSAESENRTVSKSAIIKFLHYKRDSLNQNSLSSDRIITLLEDNDGTIWAGTFDGGLNRVCCTKDSSKLEKIEFVRYLTDSRNQNRISHNTVMSILEDDDGYLWVGTFGGGLNRLDRESEIFTNYKSNPFDNNSLLDDEIVSLYQDASGIIWVGSNIGEGLTKLIKKKQTFNHLSSEPGNINSITDDVIWAIYEDDEEILWIGTYRGGLNRYDRKTGIMQVFRNDPEDSSSISDDHVRVIKEDDNNNLWIGTYNGGLNRYNKTTGEFTRFMHNPNNPNSIGNNQVQSIHIDSENILWIGTFGGGLNKISFSENDDKQILIKRYVNEPNNENSLNDNRAYIVYEDAKEYLWIGTYGGGLNRFDKKTELFESFHNIEGDPNSLSNNKVLAVFEDSIGKLWIGTYGGGLNEYDRENRKFIRHTGMGGFKGDAAYGILEDEQNNLWISTDDGLYKYNVNKKILFNYDLTDGLQSMEFSGGAYFKSKNGEMFFGGINGLNYFYPSNLQFNENIPPIVISSFKIFNNPIKGIQQNIILDYDENFFSFEFSALDFIKPQENQYSYMLEGLEEDWQYTDANIRIANYKNLSPGNYVFRVKGSNNDGIWNNEGIAVNLTLLAPFWKKWWFITLIVLFAAGIIFYIVSARIKNLIAIEKLKTKLAADLHDNIGAGLTEISILSELTSHEVGGNFKNAKKNLGTISETARVLIDSMSDIVWIVNPKRDSLYELIVRLKESYKDLLSQMGISFGISNLEKLRNVKLPMEYRQNLILIFKEGINNCIKHSKCKNIYLAAEVNRDILEMKLNDDGVGINQERLHQGNGLKNMKDRAEVIGGNLNYNSQINRGTTVQFKGKITRKTKLSIFSNN